MIMLRWCNWHIETFQKITSKTTPPQTQAPETRNHSSKGECGGHHGGVRCVLLPLLSCSDLVCVCSAGSQRQPAVCCSPRRTRGGEDREGTKGKRGWKGEPLAGHKETLWVGGGGWAVVVGGVVAGEVAAEGDEGEGE